MTESDKKKILDQWWVDNHNQMWINTHKVLGYSEAALSKWGTDLLAWSYEQFTKKSIDKQYEIWEGGKLENYLTRGMALAIKSSTSPFYYHYRKFSKKSAAINNDSDYQGRVIYKPDAYAKIEGNEQAIRDAIQNLDFYDRYLVTEYYYNGNSVKHIAETTGISGASISKDIKKALHKIKREIKNKVDL